MGRSGVSRRDLFGAGLRRLVPDLDESDPPRPPADPRETLAERRARWRLAAEASGEATLFDAAHPAVLEAGGWSAGDRLLDAGAGTGTLALGAAARGAQVTACEPVGALAALGRERSAGQPAVRWVEAELDDLPFATGSFDHAVCAFGLTACVRPREALAEVARVLAPGGTLVLAAWHPGGPIGRLLKLAERWDPSPPGTVSPLAATREERLRQDLDHHADRVEFSFAEVPLVFSDAQEAGDRLTCALAPVGAALGADAGPRRAQAVRSLAEAGEEVGGGLVLRAGFLVVVARRRELS